MPNFFDLPTTHLITNVEDLTDILEVNEELDDHDKEIGESTHSQPPTVVPLRTWQATSVQSCYMVDMPDPSQEESGEVSELSNRDIKALIDGAILEDEEQDTVRVKVLLLSSRFPRRRDAWRGERPAWTQQGAIPVSPSHRKDHADRGGPH